MKFASLGSGSRGNALVVRSQDRCILLDCGLPLRQLEAGLAKLELNLSDVDAVFVTHEHSDHVRGVKALAKRVDTPIYMTFGTALKADFTNRTQWRRILGDQAIVIGNLMIEPIVVPHDAREPCQFIVSDSSSGDDPQGSDARESVDVAKRTEALQQLGSGQLSSSDRATSKPKRLGVLTDLGS